MDASQEMSRMVKEWTETQQKLVSNWMETLRSGQSSGPDLWMQALEHWQGAVRSTLDSQGKGMRDWAAQVKQIDGASDEMKQWADQGVEMFSRWSDGQNQLWDQWFDTLRSADPAALGGGAPSNDLVKTWQNAAERMLSSQQEWLGKMTKPR
jgi:hypothetical protein